MSLLTQFYKELDGYVPQCSFCKKPMECLAHIIPNGKGKNGKLSTYGKIVQKRLNVSKQIAIDLLDMPLLNVMPSCSLCNGQGMNNSKVCKTDDITNIDDRVLEVSKNIYLEWFFESENTARKELQHLDFNRIHDTFRKVLFRDKSYIKNLQESYQRLLIGRLA